jgi:hypothetical protein
MQLEQGVWLILTLTPLADVAPHVLLMGLVVPVLSLQAFPPMCTTLIDPP